jgi:hypothetical protein
LVSGRESVTFDAAGKRAAVVGRNYSVQVWDVEASRPIGEPFVTSATTVVIGFTPAGLVAVAAGMPDPTQSHHISLLAPETGQQRADFTLPPGVELDTELTNDGQLSLIGSGGRRPSTFPWKRGGGPSTCAASSTAHSPKASAACFPLNTDSADHARNESSTGRESGCHRPDPGGVLLRAARGRPGA